jgi:ubiquinone/menaquinone biosynthesis C-methylase UbiE
VPQADPDVERAVRRFFDVRVPELLASAGDRARAIDGRCRIDVTGAGSWVVDFDAEPPAVIPGDGLQGDCQMTLGAAELLEVVADPFVGQVLAWQGRLQIGGDQALVRKAGEVLFPAPPQDNPATAGYYASLHRLIPDSRLTFMNYGFAQDGSEDEELEEADRGWRYSIGLIRRTLDGAPLDGARVLDVGCGRGGAVSYIAHYHRPAAVIGLDASADAIAFCERRHREAGLSFVHGHAERLPFEAASFDVVLNVESSHCYLDLPGFFFEVARVLRPGGAFCYADIIRPDQLSERHSTLGSVAGLRVAREQDITPGVIRAIEENSDAFAQLLVSATDGRLRNSALIANLVRTVNVDMYRQFRNGQLRYYAWRIERVTQ